jgi:hypothetical protein
MIIRRQKKRPAAIFRWKSGRVLCAPRIKACRRNRSPAGFGTTIALVVRRWRKTMAGPRRLACSAGHPEAKHGKIRRHFRHRTCRWARATRKHSPRRQPGPMRPCLRRIFRTPGPTDKGGAPSPGSKTFSIRCSAADKLRRERHQMCTIPRLRYDQRGRGLDPARQEISSKFRASRVCDRGYASGFIVGLYATLTTARGRARNRTSVSESSLLAPLWHLTQDG